ncbi:LysR family transcriptional regulator [Amphritea opalescens]|uniref:LysR family transcriptional regulator n=1 Tax=Amphritea opalescens TaxID=2490544 RepID=A0A430KVS6_9GAMM|nr:LysR substrate-binding domain-containing protein [Amphritea opalescens]RTE67558.1 LysR family transcriptional regulator [Amphritea opalescens]
MIQLRNMSVFAHVVEQGSITAAAEHLQLSKSVISQHLTGLEQALGIALLKRTTRRQSLTVAGKAFYQHCRELNRLADTAWQEAKSTRAEAQGIVRITAPDALMSSLIAPAIARTIRQHPLLNVELLSSDQPLAIVADDIDLAIRVGESSSSTLKQRRLGEFRDVLCAAADIIEQGVNENTLYIANIWQGSAIHHQFLHRQTDDKFEFSPSTLCKVDSFNTATTLIHEGAGIGLIPDFLLEQSKSSIREIFSDYQLPINPVYALHPYNNLLPLSVSVCLASIEQQLSNLLPVKAISQ